MFGAPRIKTLNISSLPAGSSTPESNTWCFRVAAVTVGNNIRTRIVASCIDGARKGTSHILEFATGIDGMSHDDLYDYDFDVDASFDDPQNTNTDENVQLVILSGKRESTDSTLASVATDLVFTCIRLKGQLFLNESGVINASSQAYGQSQAHSYSRKGSELIGYNTDGFHSISCIQITPVRQAKTRISPFNFITFLDRTASSEAATMTE